jgi:hypothetical protein
MARGPGRETRAVVKVAAVGLTIAALLSGCAQVGAPQLTPVEVPIATKCPSAPRIALPKLPITELRPDTSPSDTARAYAASVEILKGAVRAREAILDGYRDTR